MLGAQEVHPLGSQTNKKKKYKSLPEQQSRPKTNLVSKENEHRVKVYKLQDKVENLIDKGLGVQSKEKAKL